MVRHTISWALVAIVVAVITACATTQNPQSEPDGEDRCRGECVQPPLRKAELVDHLVEEQPRILAREEYMQRRPPSVLDTIYGPVPDVYLRDGPAPINDQSMPYDGELSWHYVPFEQVRTDDARHGALRHQSVSGAHCFFAHRPNRLTAIFAVLVLHRSRGRDLLYIGGPNHRVTRIDTGQLAGGRPIRVRTEAIHCAFRHDQNRVGAVILAFEEIGTTAPDEPHYAVFEISTGGKKYRTGQKITVHRRSGWPGGHTVETEIPVLKYPRPKIEFVARSPSLYDALQAAENSLPGGDFRLRPEFVYPEMPWQSYLDTGHEEFCPLHTTCRTPHNHMDADKLPRLPELESPDGVGEEQNRQIDDEDERGG